MTLDQGVALAWLPRADSRIQNAPKHVQARFLVCPATETSKSPDGPCAIWVTLCKNAGIETSLLEP